MKYFICKEKSEIVISEIVIKVKLVTKIKKYNHLNTISLSRHEQVSMFNEATFQEILLPSSGPMMGEVSLET